MPEQPDFGSVRICPACDRRVPSRVQQCRCGYAFSAAAPAVAESVEIDEPAERPERAWLRPALIISLVVFALTAYLIRTGSQEKPDERATAGQKVAPPAPTSAAGVVPPPRTATVLPIPTRVVVPPAPSPEPSTVSSFEEIVGNASAAVVSIETGTGRGTGFFVSPELIVTNAHVVQNNTNVTVRLSDGRTMPARVLRTSPVVDIAIVSPNTPQPDQSTMRMGTVNAARPGQEVIAIGSALGVLQNTVTRGIVSAVRNASGVMLIQTDAAINPGNSGGPLIDRSGRVIGITTLKIASNSESLGFAVAIDHAQPLLEGRPAELTTARGGSQAPGPLAGAFAPNQSQTDVNREQGVAFYDRTMQSLARRAESLDDYWTRFRHTCRPSVPPTSGDREWFVVLDRPPTIDPRDSQCMQWLADVTQLANGIRASMASADETARAASVYPGVKRELRKKYRLGWDGWER
jgi:S1-C subfamily serine protease